jgi:hypothetical protein
MRLLGRAPHVHDMQSRELLGTKCTQQMRQAPYKAVWSAGGARREEPKLVPAQCFITCDPSPSSPLPHAYMSFHPITPQRDVCGSERRKSSSFASQQ